MIEQMKRTCGWVRRGRRPQRKTDLVTFFASEAFTTTKSVTQNKIAQTRTLQSSTQTSTKLTAAAAAACGVSACASLRRATTVARRAQAFCVTLCDQAQPPHIVSSHLPFSMPVLRSVAARAGLCRILPQAQANRHNEQHLSSQAHADTCHTKAPQLDSPSLQPTPSHRGQADRGHVGARWQRNASPSLHRKHRAVSLARSTNTALQA